MSQSGAWLQNNFPRGCSRDLTNKRLELQSSWSRCWSEDLKNGRLEHRKKWLKTKKLGHTNGLILHPLVCPNQAPDYRMPSVPKSPYLQKTKSSKSKWNRITDFWNMDCLGRLVCPNQAPDYRIRVVPESDHSYVLIFKNNNYTFSPMLLRGNQKLTQKCNFHSHPALCRGIR